MLVEIGFEEKGQTLEISAIDVEYIQGWINTIQETLATL